MMRQGDFIIGKVGGRVIHGILCIRKPDKIFSNVSGRGGGEKSGKFDLEIERHSIL